MHINETNLLQLTTFYHLPINRYRKHEYTKTQILRLLIKARDFNFPKRGVFSNTDEVVMSVIVFKWKTTSFNKWRLKRRYFVWTRCFCELIECLYVNTKTWCVYEIEAMLLIPTHVSVVGSTVHGVDRWLPRHAAGGNTAAVLHSTD